MYEQGEGWRMEMVGESALDGTWLSKVDVPTLRGAQKVQELIALAHARGHRLGWDAAREKAVDELREALG